MPSCNEVKGRFYHDYDVPEFAFDKNNDLRVSSLQSMVQDASSRHLAAVGFDYKTLMESGFVYLLVYTKIKFYKKIKSWSTIRIYVWPKSNKGARSYRDVIVLDEDKNLVAEISTVWVLADAKNHKIVPPDNTPIDLLKVDDRPLKIGDAVRVKIPKDIKKTGERRVVYTDLDPNNHMNNCKYSDVFMDFSGIDMNKYYLEELELNYRKEVLLGESLDIYKKEETIGEKKKVYLRGTIDDKPSFDGVGIFKDR